MAKGKNILTTTQVAEICSVSTRTAQKWIDTGLLTGFLLPGGNARRTTRAELKKFMKKHKMPIAKN